MSGYDIAKGREFLPRAQLETLVKVLDEIASGKTLQEIEDAGLINRRNFFRLVTEYPDLAKALAVAREISGYSMEDKALDEAEKLVAKNDYNGTKVKAVQVAMEQWRWSAARRNQKEFGGTSGTNLVVPIQINTSLDIGQPGAKTIVRQDNVYEFAAQFEKKEAVDAEVEPVYVPPDEPVPGAAKFGITAVPKSVIPKNPGGRPPGKGHHKSAKDTAITAARQRRKTNGGTNS